MSTRAPARAWAQEDDERLCAMYPTSTCKEMAKALGRREAQVRSRCWTLRLAGKRQDWTDAELAALVKAYRDADGEPIDIAALAARMGRSHASVAVKASRLGLGDYGRNRIPGGEKPTPPKFATEEERRAAIGAATRERIARNGHPRGALGMKHTPETLAKVSEAGKRAWEDPASGHNSEKTRQRRSDVLVARCAAGEMRHGYTRSAGGRRADLGGQYFRSAWEANYARYLEWLKKHGSIRAWAFEPKTFVFESIKRGTRAYTPDFRVVFANGRVEWHEVKGWMDPKSKTRLARMRRYFPEERVVVIDETFFRTARKQGLTELIPGWESQKRGARGC